MTAQSKFSISQKFEFSIGDVVVCNGYEGTVIAVCSGQLLGMVEVRLPGGVVCVSASYPECMPA